MRLNKHIAASGHCSRREADRLIAEGRVSVNGQRAGAGAHGGKGDRTHHGAHLAGALYGVISTVLTEPRVVPYFLDPLPHPRFGG